MNFLMIFFQKTMFGAFCSARSSLQNFELCPWGSQRKSIQNPLIRVLFHVFSPLFYGLCWSFSTLFLEMISLAQAPCVTPVRQELVARSAGIVNEIYVADESQVERGSLILALDSRLLSVGLKEAQAALDMARIGEKLAIDAFERIKKLKGGDSVSQQQVVESSLKLAQARAAVSQAEAAVERLQIQLDDTRIKAEMGGIVRGLPRVKGLFVQYGQSLGYIEADEAKAVPGTEGCGRGQGAK
jgi:multidrug resistance efflux pump